MPVVLHIIAGSGWLCLITLVLLRSTWVGPAFRSCHWLAGRAFAGIGVAVVVFLIIIWQLLAIVKKDSK